MLQGIRPVFKFNVVIISIYLIKRGENMFINIEMVLSKRAHPIIHIQLLERNHIRYFNE